MLHLNTALGLYVLWSLNSLALRCSSASLNFRPSPSRDSQSFFISSTQSMNLLWYAFRSLKRCFWESCNSRSLPSKASGHLSPLQTLCPHLIAGFPKFKLSPFNRDSTTLVWSYNSTLGRKTLQRLFLSPWVRCSINVSLFRTFVRSSKASMSPGKLTVSAISSSRILYLLLKQCFVRPITNSRDLQNS